MFPQHSSCEPFSATEAEAMANKQMMFYIASSVLLRVKNEMQGLTCKSEFPPISYDIMSNQNLTTVF